MTRRVPLGEEIHALCYHEKKDAFVLGTSITVDFKLPEDEFHTQWAEEGSTCAGYIHIFWLTAVEIKFLPQVEQGSVKLMDSKTLLVVYRYKSPSSYHIIREALTIV